MALIHFYRAKALAVRMRLPYVRDVFTNLNEAVIIVGYGVAGSCGGYGGYGAFAFVLVLFILLVIILAAGFFV